MLFNSLEFLVFLPIVLVVYFIIPVKIRYLWLLAASYYFYMCWNAKYILLILTSTIITYLSGLVLEAIKKSSLSDGASRFFKNLTVAASFISNLGILFYFKYSNFAMESLALLFARLHIELNVPVFDIVLPRIAAGVRLERSDFVKLGHGGLCMGCGSCHYPACPFGKG